MYSEIVQEPRFYLDNNAEFFPEATTFIMTGEHLEFLTKVLHSRVVTYFFKRFYAGGGLGECGYRYKKAFFENLPIPKDCNNDIIKQFEIANSNNEIECLCYSIYELDDKEIEFIESQYN